MKSPRHDPYRAQRDTKALERLPNPTPQFRRAEDVHLAAWSARLDREQRSLDAEFDRLFSLPSDIPMPRNPINQRDQE